MFAKSISFNKLLRAVISPLSKLHYLLCRKIGIIKKTEIVINPKLQIANLSICQFTNSQYYE